MNTPERSCSCRQVKVGGVMFGRELDLDCPSHGTASAWWAAEPQRRARLLQSDRLRVLYGLGRVRRANADAAVLRMVVCGSRHFRDAQRVHSVISTASDVLRKNLVVITGAARGADALAMTSARALGIATREYRADWERHGEAAGPIRNGQMLREQEPHLVVAFDASGPGTKDMVRRAQAAGVVVCELQKDCHA